MSVLPSKDSSPAAEKVRSFYDAAWSARGPGETTLPDRMHAEAREFSLRWVLARVKRDRILEIGPGSGYATSRFVEAGLPTFALDLSSASLKKIPIGAHRCAGDAARLPFADKTFGTVYTASVLMFLPVGAFLDEVVRVLKPDGHAVFLEPLANNPWMRAWRALTQKYEGLAHWRSLNQLEEEMHRRFESVEIEPFYVNVPLAMLPRPLRKLLALDRPFARLFPNDAWLAVIRCRGRRSA